MELTGAEGDNVFGNLYTLDFMENWKEVQQAQARDHPELAVEYIVKEEMP